MIGYNNILFALDGLKDNDLLVEKAKRFYEINPEVKLNFVYIIEEVNIISGYESIPLLPDVNDDQTKIMAKEAMKRLSDSFNLPNVEFIVVTAYSVKSGLLQTASNLKADLIVIGSHTRHGLSILLGSTANSILNDAPCDIFIVKLSH